MKVKMNSIMAGPDGCYAAGQVVNLPAEKAEALISGGFAVSLEPEKKAKKEEPVKEQEPEEKEPEEEMAALKGAPEVAAKRVRK